MELAFFLLVAVLFALTALRWGADSRDKREHAKWKLDQCS